MLCRVLFPNGVLFEMLVLWFCFCSVFGENHPDWLPNQFLDRRHRKERRDGPAHNFSTEMRNRCRTIWRFEYFSKWVLKDVSTYTFFHLQGGMTSVSYSGKTKLDGEIEEVSGAQWEGKTRVRWRSLGSQQLRGLQLSAHVCGSICACEAQR